MDIDIEELKKTLIHLKIEHRDLDEAITRLIETSPMGSLQVQRLKKRKLILKDQILKLENTLIPDIIA